MALRRSPSSTCAESRNNGAGFFRVATALSESSSIHSDALYHLTRDMSGIGLEPMSYSILEPEPYKDEPCKDDPLTEESQSLLQRVSMQISPNEDKTPVVSSSPQLSGEGLYFSDGRRKVDYVLVFHQRRHSSLRAPTSTSVSQDRISIVSNGNFPPSAASDAAAGRAGGIPLGEAASGGEVFMEHRGEGGNQPTEPADHEMRLIRQEFEANLMEAGLEIERDRDLKTHGPSFTRLHAPWPVLCREAEFLKIKVPTKTSYKLKEESAFSTSVGTVWRKMNQPFQPKVPHQDHGRTKFLSHCFSRDKLHLYNIPSKDTFFDNATRGRIGDYKVIGQLEERNDRQILHEEWARYSAFYKYQPIDLVRKYFGEKIGLYFAWLGVYTQLLVPASIVGIIVFGYGVATVNTDIPSLEMCDERLNFTMCPLCDGACDFWQLSTACGTARASHLFDNPATVFFAIFMSLWGEPAVEKLTWKDRLPGYFINVSSILFMFGLTFSAVFGVIIYRITVSALMAMSPDPETKSNVRVTVTATAVIINLVVILILDEIYGAVAVWLTELEIPKTETNFEERLILKAFLLKFMNAYAPIFYVAFFKGRFAGRPGSYVYVFNDYRMEECAPGGCLIELCIQLSIIMLGKQLIQNNIFEIGIPKLKKLVRALKDKGRAVQEKEEERPPQQWNLDYALAPFEGLTPEYMEMIIQFGFVSLFVASFPLAPLFALLNNVIEIRLDAKKFVTELRRPVAARAKDIGIWYNILSGMGKFSVIINCQASLSYINIKPSRRKGHGCQRPQTTEADLLLHKTAKNYSARMQSLCQRSVNLVMFLSLVVAWVIPDVPKTIVEQLKREKKLLVDVFLREEKEKFQLIQSLFAKDATLPRGQGIPIPGRYSTLPTNLTGDGGGGGPRARCKAASFSQFSRESPRNENEHSRHTAV
ncbi:hypothetical protein PAMA_013058 [Pampus argenteus]